jgi:hypothetical protein
MKNKATLILVLGGFLLLSWSFASCSQPTSDPSYTVASVAGTWTASETSSGVTMTDSFDFDGTGGFTDSISMSGVQILQPYSGTYTVSGTTITITANSTTVTGTITSSTTMVFTDTSGNTVTYTKQ